MPHIGESPSRSRSPFPEIDDGVPHDREVDVGFCALLELLKDSSCPRAAAGARGMGGKSGTLRCAGKGILFCKAISVWNAGTGTPLTFEPMDVMARPLDNPICRVLEASDLEGKMSCTAAARRKALRCSRPAERRILIAQHRTSAIYLVDFRATCSDDVDARALAIYRRP